jgi:plasmid replication initiation protein
MAWHFFALDTKEPCFQPIHFSSGNIKIDVHPSSTGLATILDKDVLILVATLLHNSTATGQEMPRTVTFTVHDYCRASGRAPTGSAYTRARASIARLQGTQVSTNITTGGLFEEGYFSWITNAKINGSEDSNGKRHMTSITVEPCDWLRRAVGDDGAMLLYDLKYFDLAPLPRRIYEVARCHIGDAPGFLIGLDALKRHSGVASELKKLKFNLGAMIKNQSLPQFGLSFADQRDLEAGPVPVDRRVPLEHLALAIWPRRLGKKNSPNSFQDFPHWNPVGNGQIEHRSH